MKNINIDFQCSLNSKLLQKIIGKHLNSIHVQEGSYAHLRHESFMGLGNFYITFKNSTTNNYHSILFNPIGFECIAGDLNGFEITEKIEAASYLFKIGFEWEKCKVKSIQHYGIKSKKVFDDKKDIHYWYGKDSLVKTVLLNRMCMDFVVIELENQLLMYLFSNGKNEYHLWLNEKMKPNNFLKNYRWNEGLKVELLAEINKM